MKDNVISLVYNPILKSRLSSAAQIRIDTAQQQIINGTLTVPSVEFFRQTCVVILSMPAYSVREITKAFSSVLAVDHVSIDFHAGEIHAILGENGAGKSTLMHLLSGLYRPDPATFSSTVNRIASHPLALPLLPGSLWSTSTSC